MTRGRELPAGRRALGTRCPGHAGALAEATPRPLRGGGHRPGRRARRALRLHRQQPRSPGRPRGPGRRDGGQETQGVVLPTDAATAARSGRRRAPRGRSSTRPTSCSRPTRSPAGRCLSSAPACWSTCSTRPGPCRRATSAESVFEGAEQISARRCGRGYVERRSACRGCFIGCARRMRPAASGGEGPEYESIWALGADCGVDDLTAIVRPTTPATELGLDTITMGATIACAMELTEEGLLPGGPRFGDAAALLPLIEATAARRGPRRGARQGSARFAARYGRPELSMSVKGLELPAYDPRGMTGQGLAFATSNRGGCHLRANMLGPEILGVPKMIDRFATLGKAGLLINLQNLNAVLDSLVGVQVHRLRAEGGLLRASALGACGARRWSRRSCCSIGERIWNRRAAVQPARRLHPRRRHAARAAARTSRCPRGPARRARWSTCRRCWTSTTRRVAGTGMGGRPPASSPSCPLGTRRPAGARTPSRRTGQGSMITFTDCRPRRRARTPARCRRAAAGA